MRAANLLGLLVLSSVSVHAAELERPSPGGITVIADLPGWWHAGTDLTGFSVDIDRTVGHGGKASARIKSIVSAPTGFGSLMQVSKPGKFLSKRVRMSAWVKTEDTKYCGLWFRVDGSKHDPTKPLAVDVMSNRPIRGTTGATTAALVVSQIVTDYPLETHVFVSLLNRVPVVVATRRGGWRVDGDRIQFLGSIEKPAAEPSSSNSNSNSSHAPPIPNCQKVCSLVLAAQCPRGPRDEPDCIGPCEKSQTSSCAGSLRALIDCTGPSPRFTCDANGFVSVAGCESQYMAVLRCTSARMRESP